MERNNNANTLKSEIQRHGKKYAFEIATSVLEKERGFLFCDGKVSLTQIVKAIVERGACVKTDLLSFSMGLEDIAVFNQLSKVTDLTIVLDNSYILRLPRYAAEIKKTNLAIYEARNHAKICLFLLGNGDKIVLLTSANLNYNIRLEFIDYQKNAELYNYVIEKIEMIKKKVDIKLICGEPSTETSDIDFNFDSDFSFDFSGL